MAGRVLIVDDQEPFRLAACAVVEATPGFSVVGEVASGEDSVRAAATLRPDLVLMDVVLPGMDGPTASREIRAAVPAAVVLLLSTYDAADVGVDMSASGAAGYVRKHDFGPEVLLELDLLPR